VQQGVAKHPTPQNDVEKDAIEVKFGMNTYGNNFGFPKPHTLRIIRSTSIKPGKCGVIARNAGFISYGQKYIICKTIQI